MSYKNMSPADLARHLAIAKERATAPDFGSETDDRFFQDADDITITKPVYTPQEGDADADIDADADADADK